MKNFSYRIIDDSKKQIEIIYKGKVLKFQLRIKRAFTILKGILSVHPHYFDIHSLDSVLHDPNRAHSDLRIGNGFAHFLIERRSDRRAMQVKLDIDSLFRFYGHKDSSEFIKLSLQGFRGTLSEDLQDFIYKKYNGKCNITGIKLSRGLRGVHYFAKSLLQATFDHRKPISKGGSEELENWQLLSVFLNSEKNKICNICETPVCENCALAFPEENDVIIPNQQNIKYLKRNRR